MSVGERACCPDGTVCTASQVDYDLEGNVDGFTPYAQYDLCVDKIGGTGAWASSNARFDNCPG